MLIFMHVFIKCGMSNNTGPAWIEPGLPRMTEGNTLFGVNWNAYDNLDIHVYLGDHVSETHFVGSLIHETAHSLVNTLENEGHTDEWIRVTVRLMKLINIFPHGD